MNSLPPELLGNICDNFKDKKATLKAVRLVNRRLADVAAPLLFQTLLVYQTPKSWKNLNSIATCEWLAPYVVKLEVAVLEYLPHYLDFEDWKQFTWDSRLYQYTQQKNRAGMVSLLVEKQETHLRRHPSNLDECMSFSAWKQCPEVCSWNEKRGQGIAGDMVSELGEKLETSLPEMDSALGLVYRYQKYRYWHDGENDLLTLLSHSKGSHLDPIPFPNLRTMSVLGSYELWKGAIWPLAQTNRKFRESADPMFLTRVVPRNVHLSLTLQTLGTSGVKITRLELHRYREILADPNFHVPPLKHLQELVLGFPFGENYVHSFRECEQWELVPWLRGADDLRTLILLSQDPEGHAAGIETFVRPKSLLQFLSEHKQSLESIRIERPIFPKKEWQSLESELFDVDFRSPDCQISMTTEDYYFQSKYAAKDWFANLEYDDEWIDSTTEWL